MERALEALTFLDTHVAVWLYAGEVARLSPRVTKLLRASRLFISPAVRAELALLREIGRTTVHADTITVALSRDFGVSVAADAFDAVVSAFIDVEWTRDPFDRLIVGHAALHDAILVTKDRHLRSHYRRAFW